MANSEVSRSVSSVEEGDIDQERIVDGHLVPEEYFCPICRCLLWKPRSCASCQHLFCEKCVRMWLANANSGNKCPFRCEPFEDRRCPPYVHSLLARLSIRCRNSSLGCTQTLPYDALEQHENVECQYLTRRCSECEQLVLVNRFNEHCQMPGLCIPCPIKCTICQSYIEKSLFRDHFHSCCQQRLNEFMEQTLARQTLNTIANGQPVPTANGLALIQSIVNTVNLFEQQREMSRLPTNLTGVDAIRRAREQGCGHVYHIFIMLKFILMNWSKAPFFILIFSIGGFSTISFLILGAYLIFSNWVYTHIYRGCFLIMLLSYLISYGASVFFQFVSDTTTILCFGISIFFCGCSTRMSLEILEMNALINKPKLSSTLCCVGILIMKLILLFIRFYYWVIPIYIAAGLIALINFYLTFKAHRVYINTVTASVNQATTTV